MQINYKYEYGKKMYVICEILNYGVITNEMYINNIKTKMVGKDEFVIEYNLVTAFVNIDIVESIIDAKEPTVYDTYTLWVFSDELECKKFLKENF